MYVGRKVISTSQGQSSIVSKIFPEFFSEALRKTHSMCKLNVLWCASIQHMQGQTLIFLQGSISSFLILNSGKDCKGWRSQFRSVANEGSTKCVRNPKKREFARQTRDEKCYAFLAFFAKQKATQRIKI